MQDCWYALQVKPRAELVCTTLLTQKGYEVFVPSYIRRLLRKGRIVAVPEVLFPGYLFCRVTEQSVGKMVATPGVVRIVGGGGRPVPVDADEMESLQRLVESDVARRPWKYLPEGCRVEIRSGPLSGARGVLMAEDGRRALVVSVSLLQRAVLAQLDEETVLRPLEWSQGNTEGVQARVAMSLLAVEGIGNNSGQ
jgi:transcription antitermination factor NusG